MYETNLKIFYEYCIHNEIINLNDITQSTMKKFFLVMKEENKNNVGTLNNKIRNLKAFFNYLVEEEMLDEKRNPMKKIKQVKQEVKIEVPTDAQVKQIIKYFERQAYRNGSFLGNRNRMMIIFLISTGVRRAEVVNIKWSDIDFQNNSIKVFGKKRQIASIPMTIKLRKELAEYRMLCEHHFKELGDYVFCSRSNKQITDEAISTLFKRVRRDMGSSIGKIHCHSFRHYFASKAIQNGLDMSTLQKILRHESSKITQQYVNLWGTAIHEQNEKFNPLNTLDI
jgi:integrase/recombinase XerD